jgi:hypothetical protein
MKLRLKLKITGLLKILLHLPHIDTKSLELVCRWPDGMDISTSLFKELVALNSVIQGAHITALDNTMTMHRLKGQGRLKPFRSSSEIWAQHDKLVEWLAPQIRQERKDLCDLVFPPPPLSGTPSIHPITSSELLLEEGKTQHHCASIYAEAVATGHVYFYQMFEPERVTICIERCDEAWVLKEAKTTCNAEIQPGTSRQISDWLDERKH